MTAMIPSWSSIGSTIASLMFIWAVAKQYFPHQLNHYISTYTSKIVRLVYPYIEITFNEYTGERFKRSEVYAAIETYLADSSSRNASRLKAEPGRDDSDIVLSMDDSDEIILEFEGVKLWWSSNKIITETRSLSFNPKPDERRFYRLRFHRRHREIILNSYLQDVINEGKTIEVKKRQRKLYTNSSNFNSFEYKKSVWSHVPFEHPANFDTLALDPEKRKEIIEDLDSFSKGEEFYKRIGKPWKRGYLLFGPPGTGKSTMISAMANHLKYDVYDLELTAVKNNTQLRKLLIETTSKSIIVIEDIDCSIDLSGKRKNEASSEAKSEEEMILGNHKEESKVTLSGLLNFIDGLWSSCGGEKIIIFTTNHVEKLDPALTRRGRMDKHIELSYCGFEAFKILARNYLQIDSHPTFNEIQMLLEYKEITPADVAEILMPKTLAGVNKIEACLGDLIKALNECKSKFENKEATETETEAKEATDETKKLVQESEEVQSNSVSTSADFES